MAQPLFLPTDQDTVDGYNNPNIPIVKPMALRQGALGPSFKHFLLPDNAGGTVSISNNISADDSRQYNTSQNILPHMALIYNAHGGVVTPDFGEASDLNNPFNFAGIALTNTLIETSNWLQKTGLTNIPAARASTALAFNQTTRTSVLFGGVASSLTSLYDDTWEWNGIIWNQRTLVTSPPLRQRHDMIYDSDNMVVVLYGGIGNSSLLDDTWTWDGGSTWTLAEAHSPAGLNTRHSHAMAYDSLRQKTVLFGGFHVSDNDDTWEWDGFTWTEVVTVDSPTARVLHAMTFDLSRSKVILFGGTVDAKDVVFGDTWEYDGVNWVQNIVPGTNPPARSAAKIVYNTSKKVSVLFGGVDINFVPFNDIWEYDGTSWTQLNIVTPSPRAAQAMDYDITRDKIVLFGGEDQTQLNIKGDTWELGRSEKPVLVQAHGDGYVFYDASVGRPVPAIGDFFGPGAVSGTVTSTIIPPIFGYAVSPPVIDPLTSLPLELNINESTVGLIQMRIEAFYGFLAIPAPSLVNFSPTFGPVDTVVTINGTSFLGTTQVRFDGGLVNAVYSIVSNIQLLVTVPAGAQTGTITVTTSVGSNTSVGIFSLEPIITGVTAPIRSAGAAVTINGHTFTSTISVEFNGVSSGFVVVNDATITTTIPFGATTGSITVTTSDGTATFPDFLIVPLPTIGASGVSPLQGPVGSFVSIVGSGFFAPGADGDGLGVLQFINVGLGQTLVAQRTIFSDTQISAIVPDPSVPQGSIVYIIRFISDGGQVDAAQNYTIIPTPKFLASDSFTPIQGAPGTLVTITGAWGFTGLVSVTFGNFQSSVINFVNDTQITAVVPVIPALDNPNVGIRVVAGGGTRSTTDAGPSTSPSTFTILLQPSIDAFTPISGAVNTSVSITGNNLLTVDHVFFATATSNDGYTARDVSDIVTVITNEQHGFEDGDNILVASDDSNFTSGYFNITLVDEFTFEYTQSGSTVANASPIYFGDASINTSFIVNSNTQITATVPFKSTGITSEPIIVSSGDSPPLFSVSLTSFTYIPKPTITSLNKTSGGFGNPPTQVFITGENLLWNIGNNPSTGNSNPTVKFGNIIAPIISASSTDVTVTVPNGATNGFTLTTDGGTDGYSFTVVQPPIVYYSTPTSGQTNFGGTNVSIVGNNFIQTNGVTTVSFFHDLFFLVSPTSTTNGLIVVNTAQIDFAVNPDSGTTFIVYVTISYDSGNGKYQVNSPNSYFGFDNIS